MKLVVYYNEHKVGELIKELPQSLLFTYANEWLVNNKAFPISLSMPLANKTYSNEIATPFFAGLLPEAGVRELVAKKLHVSVHNDFSLLSEIGCECAGALSLWPENETIKNSGEYIRLSQKDLNSLFFQKNNSPLLLGKNDLRLSLAGAQEKIALYLDDDKWLEPTGGLPSTHILKPSIPYFEQTVYNELFCMLLAKDCDLPVPESYILNLDEPVFVIKRYDRIKKNNSLIRLHQEDFCQALSIHPNNKYESELGPSLKKCFMLIEQHCQKPLLDKKSLLNWVFYNYYIGNTDAHAKNLSWLINQKGFQLAPFYDLMSTAIYPNLTNKLAMKIGKENRLDWIAKRDFERFAKDVGVSQNMLLDMHIMFGQTVLLRAEKLITDFEKEHGSKEIVSKIVDFIKKQVQRAKNITLSD